MKTYLKYFLFLTISFAIVALDQATKMMIHTQFNLGEKKVIIPGFFNITYVRNTGGVFGLFSESNDVIRMILFIILPVLAFVLILSIIHKLDIKQKYQILAFSSIFGGALGNYIDRIHFGYVVDFLDFYYKGRAWPAFNVADMCIVIGVFSAITLIYITEEKQKKKALLLKET
ncbi:MAG: signal peptidase II [Bdellovibrionales bacterium]|nr:signal peptidase II [Bdellovibrionales bacterium]